MSKMLIITNLCEGSLCEDYPMSCRNAEKVCENIIHLSDRYKRILVVNDRHTSDDPEFNFLPPSYDL